MKILITDVDLAVGKTISKLVKDASKQAVKSTDLADSNGADKAPVWLNVEIYGTRAQARPPAMPKVGLSASKNPGPLEKYSMPGIVHDWVVEVEKDNIFKAVDQCDVIVLTCPQDTTDRLISEVIEYITQISKNNPEVSKTVVFVSNVMTWFRSELTDAESALTEDDYRKRKCHPNFKWLMELERSISKIALVTDETQAAANIKPYIVCAGMAYHPYDGWFHSLLRNAWSGNDSYVYGKGENSLPLIHLHDLANVVVKLVEKKPASNYILAVDDSKGTYADLVKNISESLGNGVVKERTLNEAALDKGLTSQEVDMLKLNLRLDSTTAKDLTEFAYESGAVDHLPALIQEFRYCRGLEPICAFVHGPPLSGKTSLAQKLTEVYKVILLDANKAIDIFLAREVPEDQKEKQAAIKAQLAAGTKLDDEKQVQIVQDVLSEMRCRNQGYILDGFPETFSQVQAIFGDRESKVATPNYVIDLEMSDDAIKDRLIDESQEESVLKRLEVYRTEEKQDNHVLDFFEQLDITVQTVSNSQAYAKDAILDLVKNKIGFRGYGLSRQEIDEQYKQAIEEEERQRAFKEQSERKQKEEEEAKRKAYEAEWEKRIAEIKRQEIEMLEARSAPLRKYLVDNILPTLTAALVEVSKVRPADPCDYVADYLFRHSKTASENHQ